MPTVEIDENELPASCSGASFRTAEYEHDILRWSDEQPAKFRQWDARADTRDAIYGIADYLDHHNIGRIKRQR